MPGSSIPQPRSTAFFRRLKMAAPALYMGTMATLPTDRASAQTAADLRVTFADSEEITMVSPSSGLTVLMLSNPSQPPFISVSPDDSERHVFCSKFEGAPNAQRMMSSGPAQALNIEPEPLEGLLSAVIKARPELGNGSPVPGGVTAAVKAVIEQCFPKPMAETTSTGPGRG